MEQQNREYDDEINLYDFWKVIVKRKMLIIGLFIVIVGLTAIGSFLMPDIYRWEAGLSIIYSDVYSDVIKAKELTDLIGRVDSEKQLRMVPKSYPNVTNIKFNAIKDSKNIIEVSIDAKKIDDIPRALSEVLVYLNNMDIMRKILKRN